MANSLDHLAAVLDEKRAVIEELKLLLKNDQEYIVQLDLEGLEANDVSKEKVLAQLHVLNNLCRDRLNAAGAAYRLPPGASLTPLVESVGAPYNQQLHVLQKGIIEAMADVEQLNRLNGELLENSLRMTNRSVEFFNRIFGRNGTYGASGRMTEGAAEGSLLRREI